MQNGNKRYEGQGLIGLSPNESEITGLDRILVGGRWFGENEREAVMLPQRMAQALGIDPKNPRGQVMLWGVPMEVVGVFFRPAIRAAPGSGRGTADPGDISPKRLLTSSRRRKPRPWSQGRMSGAFQSRYQHIAGDLTVIIPARTLLAVGGALKGLAIRPKPGVDVEAMARDMVERLKLSIFMGEKEGTFLYHASETLSYSGVPNIIIPIAISIFIVLNTMIGSVYERKREIGIYTSVGLAPSHVSFLFIAEAAAFAVLSVVFGYLVAQASTAVFAGTSLWSGITVNYSSLAGVFSMLLIFMVVLVSVIYPSRVAARIAIPDVNRSWTLPETKDSTLRVVLPVLMKYNEVEGVAGFVYEYFFRPPGRFPRRLFNR